jgi:hypothetical protein
MQQEADESTTGPASFVAGDLDGTWMETRSLSISTCEPDGCGRDA